jgi:HlyD family secretion protein
MTQPIPNPQTLSQPESKPGSKPELSSPKPKSSHQFNPQLLIPVGIAIAAIGYGIWTLLPKPAETLLRLSGRLESDETEIGAKTGGRVIDILVREGDRVKKGQIVVSMADEEVTQQLSGLVAQVEAAKQEEAQAKYDISVTESRIKEADVNLQQAKGDSLGRIDQASSNVSAAESDLRQAEYF